MNQPVQVRCAIYVRKSSDDNLDIAFNSLEAQREFCEKYASDRQSQGWIVLPETYEDGGVTGGTLERPGLKKLLTHVKARQLDCILTYKIDRLSRSQLGFLQLQELFAENKVSFVSVTQPFETATATGRAMIFSPPLR